MPITDHEMSHILSKIMSPTEIEANGGPCPKQLSRILQKSDHKMKSSVAIVALMIKHSLMPYDKAWQYPIEQLYDLHAKREVTQIERRFLAQFQSVKILIDENNAAIEPGWRIGALYFAALYLLAFVNSKYGTHAGFRAEAFEAACRYFRMVIDELADNPSLAALLLSAKAAGNMVVSKWNFTPGPARGSRDMKRFIVRSGYLRWAVRQAQEFPKNETPAMNLLAAASRWAMLSHGRCYRRFYPALHAALLEANPDFEKKPAYQDEDYADFRQWLAAQEPSQKAD